MRLNKGLARRLGAGICIPAAVAVSALALALPASAAPSANAASSVTAVPAAAAAQLSVAHLKGPLPPALYRGVRTVTTVSYGAIHARLGAFANQPCTEITATLTYFNNLYMILWQYFQHTYFCWDYVTVTNHVTSEDIYMNPLASVAGWGFKGVISSEFNCFYANGSTRWCSANHEHSQGEFDYCVLKIGCLASVYPWADQREYYNGASGANTGT